MDDLNDRLVSELIDSVRQVLRKEASERLREVYLVGDIDKDTARTAIERMRELANDSSRPITLYLNTAGGNVTDGLAIHDVVRQIISRGIEVTIIVQGMAYSMGSIVLQAASDGRRLSLFVEQSLGNINKPLSDRQLVAKFRDQAVANLPAGDVERLIELTWKLEELADVSEIVQAAVPASARFAAART